MGKIIVLAVVLVGVVIVLGLFISWLANHNDKVRRGISGRSREIKLLQREHRTHLSVISDIREIAASSYITTGDPLWESVMSKADEVLDPKGKKR